MLPKTQEILLETQGNLFKTQGTGAFEHNQAPKNRTNKKPDLNPFYHSPESGMDYVGHKRDLNMTSKHVMDIFDGFFFFQ